MTRNDEKAKKNIPDDEAKLKCKEIAEDNKSKYKEIAEDKIKEMTAMSYNLRCFNLVLILVLFPALVGCILVMVAALDSSSQNIRAQYQKLYEGISSGNVPMDFKIEMEKIEANKTLIHLLHTRVKAYLSGSSFVYYSGFLSFILLAMILL